MDKISTTQPSLIEKEDVMLVTIFIIDVSYHSAVREDYGSPLSTPRYQRRNASFPLHSSPMLALYNTRASSGCLLVGSANYRWSWVFLLGLDNILKTLPIRLLFIPSFAF